MQTYSSKLIIISGFSFIVLALCVMVSVTIFTLRENQSSLDRIVNEQGESAAIFKMRDSAYQRAIALHRMAIMEDEFDRDEEYLHFQRLAEDFIKARNEFFTAKTNREESQIWERMQPSVAEGSRVQKQAVEMILNGGAQNANNILLNEVIPKQNKVMDELTSMLDIQRRVTDESLTKAAQRSSSVAWLMMFVGGFAVLLSVAIAAFAVRRSSAVEGSLNLAREAAMSADSHKSQFLANMSHEIRTPLTAIIGFSEAMLDEKMPFSERMSNVNSVVRNGKHLLQLINDILDMSKIEANQLSVEQISVSPIQLVSEVESLIGDRARDKGLEFKVHYHFPLPECIKSDPTRLKQILLNLCGNAIKFTAEGKITLTVSVDKLTKTMRFMVEDTGIGMSSEEQAVLFKRFRQADDSTTRKFGGTGLGLFISKQLAQKLGGDLTVHSEKGQGSSFILDIPVPMLLGSSWVDDLAQVDMVSTHSKGGNVPVLSGSVLLAEDSLDNQRLISMYINRTGADVVVVSNGQEAVESALEHDFDLILMDMQMPVMGGIEAIKWLRMSGKQTPISALTANAMKEDRDRCREAGATDFLTKPIDMDAFYELLEKYLNPVSANQGHQEVLISSYLDDEDMRDLVEQFLMGLPEMQQNIMRSIDERHWDDAKGFVHQLKGLGGGFGYPQITDACVDLEKALKEQDVAAIEKNKAILNDVCNAALAGYMDDTAAGSAIT